jgi:hypothetical protein
MLSPGNLRVLFRSDLLLPEQDFLAGGAKLTDELGSRRGRDLPCLRQSTNVSDQPAVSLFEG